MQINGHLSITRDLVSCSTCGREIAGATLEAGATRLCRHASSVEVRRILSLLAEGHRRRHAAPCGEVLLSVQSQHHNGTYELSVLPDGSFACACLSFLGSRDLEPCDVAAPGDPGRVGCKHIRENADSLTRRRAGLGRTHHAPQAPSDWQKLVFKAFSVDPHPELTNAQAYVAIGGLLAKQGVEYHEIERLMKEQGRISLLPVYAFGVEFEGAGIPHAPLAEALTAAGVPTVAEGYTHELRDHFKVVSDASVRGNYPYELVTPKLFGAQGFEKIQTLCRVVRAGGGDANVSCGLHVHVDAWNCRIAEARRLLALWHRIQPVILLLVPPSRRSNHFCKPVGPELVERVNAMRSVAELGRLDRYYMLNLSAFGRHGTFEYRLHGGTFNARKVESWIVFVLLLTAAARAGLDPASVPVTWEGVTNALGLTTGTSVIRRAHRYLSERYALFSSSAASGESPAADSSTEAA